MPDIPGNTTTTAAFPTAINPMSSFSGDWETFGDHDWIRVNLTAGVTYTFTAFSKQPYAWASSGPELRLRNAAGTQIAYDNDSGPGLNALITFTASTSGTYYLDVSAFGANFGDDLPGEYSVSVSRQGAANYLMETAGYYQATAGQRVLGSDGDDEIRGFFVEAYGGNGDDYISADGDVGVAQTISGGPGDDRIYAGQAPATLFGDSGFDFLDGYAWNDRLYGGADADYLYGHQGNDWLDGGTGADRLEGTVGDDTCIVDNSADLALEQSGQGRDTVLASVSYALAFGQEFETLGTTSATGTAAINLTGNEFAQRIDGNNGVNILTGNGGNDTLYGYAGNDRLNGGTGVDLMSGGLGDDVFYVDIATDRAFETANQGTDTVLTSVSYALAAGQHIEKLATTLITGTAAIRLTGNELAQTISGNNGANVIAGGGGNDVLAAYGGNDTLDGGTGNDVLYGGAGNDMLNGGADSDYFVFNTALNAATNVDRIVDFNVPQDTIWLDNAVMAGLGTTLGTLSAAKFWKNTTGLAHDADDRIIYETDTGKLFYDSNGNASGGAIHFATLAPNLALTNADFAVI